jgi:hypothetical protein
MESLSYKFNETKLNETKFNDPELHSFIDIGVRKTDNKNIKINGKNIVIDEKSSINPFFVGMNGGSVLTITPKDLHKNYKYIYVMCLKDSTIIDQATQKLIMNIFCFTIEKEKLKEICDKFTLIKASSNLLKNYNLKKKANIVENNILKLYFDKIIASDELNEIIVPMFELNETKVKLYLKMYGHEISINEIGTMMSLSSHYNKNFSSILDKHIVEMIQLVDQSFYWMNPKNCNFNMDDIFGMRTLSYNGHRLDQIRYATLRGAKNLNEYLTKLDKKKGKSIKIKKEDNYLEGINDSKESKEKMKSEHMNIYQVLRESDHRTFYATLDEGQFEFTKDDVANLFDRITDEKYRFHLLNAFLVSKEKCHFVVNNKRVLIRNADLFEKYKPLYAYIFGYAWVTLYLEESIFTTKSTKKNRYVFDIDTAYELPMFPFSMENIHNNPYITLLLNKDLVDPATNCMSINSLEDYKKHYGVCKNEEALKRFNVFTSGRHDINIFKGLDPNIFSFSGSIMTACIQRYSPLIDLCTDANMTFDDIYGTYFNHYYKDSDIDVMCGVTTTAEFLTHATKFIGTLCQNLNCQRSDIKVVPNKKTAIVISKHFFKNCLDDLNEQTGKNYTVHELINIFEEALSNEDENVNDLPAEIIQYFHYDYVQEKDESIKKWRSLQQINNIEFDSEFLNGFNDVTSKEEIRFKTVHYDLTEKELNKKDHEIYYFVNDFRSDDDKVPPEKNFLVFKFSESIKYKLQSEKTKRTIEIFKIDPIDPFSTTARFHFPCVRVYLQGDKFYMLPSFITSMMTMINQDYKYFAGSHNPCVIFNKYDGRGYSLIANPNEKKAILLYNMNIDETNGMFKVENAQQQFGPKDLNNKIYKPGVYLLGLPEQIYKKSNHVYIKSVGELKDLYKRKHGINLDECPIDMINYTTIGKNGNITPYRSWIAQSFYEYINKNN